ncbi:class I SAM-dependent methyltransferase [Trinickia mobilis]|uniref:class I SAM-dependent methyltransferase n=1 Tax=Trinickia mobilis TaxID=2816356 RepID=UPI001A8C592E|nr:class I SAM-dependent methyltransferase [Trinickia mobilis]
MSQVESWVVGDLPFFYKCQPSPTNAAQGLPDTLPFELEFEPADGLVRQRWNPEVDQALSAGYLHGSEISGMMEADGIGRQYADDFLAFLQRSEGSFAGKRVLEIGCGTGYLLSRLRELGAEVMGIEPGDHGQDGARRNGVPVVQGFFPHPDVSSKFDVIIAYGVLEHIVAPVQFMQQVAAQLGNGGGAYLAVPDCEPYLLNGDISCLLHEHWSYFTAYTLSRVLRRAGFAAETFNSGFGGSLYGRCRASHHIEPDGGRPDATLFRQFRERAGAVAARMAGVFSDAEGEVGLYVPGRLMNLMSNLDPSVISRLRFFDDNPRLTGQYFPGIPVPIEDFSSLVAHAPSSLLIATRSFHSAIVTKLREAGVSIPTLGWADVFEAEYRA